MKKYGKFEKQPEKAAPKQAEMKSVLLQTYFTSLLCLVLCVSMFFGTSYAWFTSEVTNTANEIYVGTLKVGLYKQIPPENEESTEPDYVSLSEVDANGSNTHQLFDEDIRWEPGYTDLETIAVENQGELAFKYVMNFTDGNAKDAYDKAADLENVAGYFTVWVHSGEAAPASYSEITDPDNGWTKVGTLAEVLSGKVVLQGELEPPVENGAKETTAAGEETVTEGEAEEQDRSFAKHTIALHMNEIANTSVMGHKISLSVKLVAYQRIDETDAAGNKEEIKAVSDVSALQEALNGNGNVLLTSDIASRNPEECISMTGGILDGNKKTLTYGNGQKLSETEFANLITVSGGTIGNLTVTGGSNARALYSTNLEEDLFVSDCVLSGAYAFNLISVDGSGNTEHTITFVDTTFNAYTVFENMMEHAYFTGCTFNQLLKPHGDTTLTNCTITDDFLVLSALKPGETVTLINCTYKGTEEINAVFTKADEQIVQEGNTVFAYLDSSGTYGVVNNG